MTKSEQMHDVYDNVQNCLAEAIDSLKATKDEYALQIAEALESAYDDVDDELDYWSEMLEDEQRSREDRLEAERMWYEDFNYKLAIEDAI